MKKNILCLILALLPPLASAREAGFAAANDVKWNSPGTNENDSMPVGHGDIALNVWTEQNGDIVLLIAKSDAWSENGQLLKLGQVRVKLSPNPFTATPAFAEKLKLETGEIEITDGKNAARIWVDANHPVAHVEVKSAVPVQMEARSEVRRTRSYHLNQSVVAQGLLRMWQ